VLRHGALFYLEVIMDKIAIMIDGGFYRKRASYLWGKKTTEKRANELYAYCMSHIGAKEEHKNIENLYRIFYYDCPPIGKVVYNPITGKNVDFSKSDTYKWALDLFEELKKKRKLALRLGELSDTLAGFILKPDRLKLLCSNKINISDLTENDIMINFGQKGVDMRIGIDIASVTFKKQANRIILISGDSDFVPAAKLSRREGIDFVLDPMGAQIKPSLFEHIDGLGTPWKINKNSGEKHDNK